MIDFQKLASQTAKSGLSNMNQEQVSSAVLDFHRKKTENRSIISTVDNYTREAVNNAVTEVSRKNNVRLPDRSFLNDFNSNRKLDIGAEVLAQKFKHQRNLRDNPEWSQYPIELRQKAFNIMTKESQERKKKEYYQTVTPEDRTKNTEELAGNLKEFASYAHDNQLLDFDDKKTRWIADEIAKAKEGNDFIKMQKLGSELQSMAIDKDEKVAKAQELITKKYGEDANFAHSQAKLKNEYKQKLELIKANPTVESILNNSFSTDIFYDLYKKEYGQNPPNEKAFRAWFNMYKPRVIGDAKRDIKILNDSLFVTGDLDKTSGQLWRRENIKKPIGKAIGWSIEHAQDIREEDKKNYQEHGAVKGGLINLKNYVGRSASGARGGFKWAGEEATDIATGATSMVLNSSKYLVPKKYEKHVDGLNSKIKKLNQDLNKKLARTDKSEQLGEVAMQFYSFGKIATLSEKAIAKKLYGKQANGIKQRVISEAISDASVFGTITALELEAKDDLTFKNWIDLTVKDIIIGQVAGRGMETPAALGKVFKSKAEIKAFKGNIKNTVDRMKDKGINEEEIIDFFDKSGADLVGEKRLAYYKQPDIKKGDEKFETLEQKEPISKEIKEIPQYTKETPSVKDQKKFEEKFPDLEIRGVDDMKLLRDKKTQEIVGIENRRGEQRFIEKQKIRPKKDKLQIKEEEIPDQVSKEPTEGKLEAKTDLFDDTIKKVKKKEPFPTRIKREIAESQTKIAELEAKNANPKLIKIEKLKLLDKLKTIDKRQKYRTMDKLEPIGKITQKRKYSPQEKLLQKIIKSEQKIIAYKKIANSVSGAANLKKAVIILDAIKKSYKKNYNVDLQKDMAKFLKEEKGRQKADTERIAKIEKEEIKEEKSVTDPQAKKVKEAKTADIKATDKVLTKAKEDVPVKAIEEQKVEKVKEKEKKSFYNKFREFVDDNWYSAKKLQEKKGIATKEGSDPYQQEKLLHGRADTRIKNLDEKTFNIDKNIKKYSGSNQNYFENKKIINAYMLSKDILAGGDAKSFSSDIAKGNIKLVDNLSDNSNLMGTIKKTYELHQETNKYLFDNGLRSKKTFDFFDKRKDNIPYSETKNADGSYSLDVDILSSVRARHEIAIKKVEENKLKKEVLGLSRDNPEGLEHIFEEVDMKNFWKDKANFTNRLKKRSKHLDNLDKQLKSIDKKLSKVETKAKSAVGEIKNSLNREIENLQIQKADTQNQLKSEIEKSKPEEFKKLDTETSDLIKKRHSWIDEEVAAIRKNLEKESKKFDISGKQFEEQVLLYNHAKHAPDYNAKHGDGAAGIFNIDSKKKIKELKNLKQFNSIKKFAKKVQIFDNRVLKMFAKEKMVSNKLVRELEGEFPNHVSLQRELPFEKIQDDFATNIPDKAPKEGDLPDPIIRGKGSSLKVKNILDNAAYVNKRAASLIEYKKLYFEKAKADFKIRETEIKNELKDIKVREDKLNTDLKKFKQKKGDLLKEQKEKLVKKLDKDIELINRIKEVNQIKMDNIATEKARIEYEMKNAPEIMNIMEDGKLTNLHVKDNDLAKIYNKAKFDTKLFHSWAGKKFEKFIYNPTTWTTKQMAANATSRNPGFWVGNAPKDLWDLTMNASSDMGAKGGFNALKSVFKGENHKAIIDHLRSKDTPGAREYEEMRLEGGTTGGFGMQMLKKVEKDFDKLIKANVSKTRMTAKKTSDFVEAINTLIEDANRLAAYKAARKKGLSKRQSAIIAKESTINFNKKGQLGETVGDLFLFLNPSIQGTVKNFKNFKKNPKVMASFIGGFGSLMFLNRTLNNGEDEDWEKKINPQILKKNIVFMNPFRKEGEFSYITIPISEELERFKNFFDNSHRTMFSETSVQDASNNFMDFLVNSFDVTQTHDWTQRLTPSVLRPFVDPARNKGHHGGNIEPEGKDWEKLHHYDRYYNSTKESTAGKASIKLSQVLYNKANLDISPEHFKYFFEQALGGVGRSSARIIDTAKSPFTEGDLPVKDTFGLRRFYGKPNEDEIDQNVRNWHKRNDEKGKTFDFLFKKDDKELAVVIKVIDGDTIDVLIGDDKIERIRQAGVDTAEIVSSKKGAQFWGLEGSLYTKKHINVGDKIYLEKSDKATPRTGKKEELMSREEFDIIRAEAKESWEKREKKMKAEEASMSEEEIKARRDASIKKAKGRSYIDEGEYDRFNRALKIIYLENKENFGEMMLRSGTAKVSRYINKDSKGLQKIEAEAKKAKKGIWQRGGETFTQIKLTEKDVDEKVKRGLALNRLIYADFEGKTKQEKLDYLKKRVVDKEFEKESQKLASSVRKIQEKERFGTASEKETQLKKLQIKRVAQMLNIKSEKEAVKLFDKISPIKTMKRIKYKKEKIDRAEIEKLPKFIKKKYNIHKTSEYAKFAQMNEEELEFILGTYADNTAKRIRKKIQEF